MISAVFWGYKLLCSQILSSLSSFEEMVLRLAFEIYFDSRRLTLTQSFGLYQASRLIDYPVSTESLLFSHLLLTTAFIAFESALWLDGAPFVDRSQGF